MRSRSPAGSGTAVTLGAPVAIRIANTEWPKWETVMSPDPVAADVLADQARDRPADPAPPRPRRPGRHAEIRPRGRTAGARAGERARDRRPGGARRASQAYLRQSFGIEIVSHVVAIGHVCAPDGARAGTGRRRTRGCGPGALPGPGGERGDAGGDRRRPDGRRHARRGGRGDRLRRAARPGQPRALGPPARRTAGRRADEHPGDQGRRDRRRLRHRPAPRARRPTTRSRPARRGSAGARTGPAGWRAA